MSAEEHDYQNTSPSSSKEARMELCKCGVTFDMDYILRPRGILKAAQAVLSLIAFICVASSRDQGCNFVFGSTYNFFEFVSMSAFLIAAVIYIIYSIRLQDKLLFKLLPWFWVTSIWCAVYGVFYLIGSAVIAAQHCYKDGNKAGAAFGFFTLGALLGDGFLSVQEFRTQRASSAASPQSTDDEHRKQELY